MGALLLPSLAFGWKIERDNVLYTGEVVHDAPITMNDSVTVNGAIDLAGDIVDLNITDSVTIGGKTTANGELEVNNSDVDINLTGTTDEITITQTNVTGADGIPMMSITDARTGTFANEADEASLTITAAGTYGLSVLDGIVNIEGEIDCTGDMTLDPAGDDLIVDATIDATALTVDAGAGVDTKTGGALSFGSATATSTDIGKSGTMTTVKGTLNVDQAVTFDTTLGVTGNITAPTFSNDTGKAYVQTLEVTTTVSVPADSLETTDLGAGNLPTDVIATAFSNDTGKVYAQTLEVVSGGTVTVPADAVSIDAINGITVTAAAINDAGNGTTATLTPTLVSNATLKVYAQELVATTTVTIPDDSIAVGKIGAGTLPDDVIGQSISNLAGYVYASNVNVTAGGALVIEAGGTFTVPVDAVSIDAVNGITVTAAALNDAGNGATATLTPTLVSNATGKVYMQTVEIPSGGTVTLPDASIASAALPAAIINSTIVSNATLVVDGATGTFSTSIEAPKVYLASGDEFFQTIGTQLVFIANNGAATNVIDADITTP